MCGYFSFNLFITKSVCFIANCERNKKIKNKTKNYINSKIVLSYFCINKYNIHYQSFYSIWFSSKRFIFHLVKVAIFIYLKQKYQTNLTISSSNFHGQRWSVRIITWFISSYITVIFWAWHFMLCSWLNVIFTEIILKIYWCSEKI